MNLTERDRKIALVILPVVVVAVYWFLLMAPKREQAAKASKEVAEQTERLDAARTQAKAAENAQTDFASDYTEIVRLGKAIPSGVDMPSLIVQIDRAAAGTGIRFTRMGTGPRTPVVTAAPAPTGTSAEGATPADDSTPPADGATPAADAGGAPAQTAPGSAVESANNTAQDAAQASDAATQSGVDTQTSTSTGGGGLPVGGGAAPSTTGAPAANPAGLETVPLELEFVGNFFSLADFFHDIKRFVRVANNNVLVSGRLITVEGVRFASEPELFPRIRAEVTATVYLSPKTEGTTAGATPQGPAPAAPGTETTPTTTPPSSTPAPTATATP
jgi:Tfp pilus assembly protein PilO